MYAYPLMLTSIQLVYELISYLSSLVAFGSCLPTVYKNIINPWFSAKTLAISKCFVAFQNNTSLYYFSGFCFVAKSFEQNLFFLCPCSN